MSNGKTQEPSKPRVWTEADETALLRGILEYHSTKGTDPSSKLDRDVILFVKDFLQEEYQQRQLEDKKRRLKDKYFAIARKGADPSFATNHEQELYQLSKEIWGAQSTSVLEGDDDDDDADVNEGADDSLFPYIREAVLEMGSSPELVLKSIGNSRARDIEKRLEKIKLVEMKQYMNELALKKDGIELFRNALAKSKEG